MILRVAFFGTMYVQDPDVIYSSGEIYSPPETDSVSENDNPMQPPRLHSPLPDCEALVTSAPYLSMVDLCLNTYLTRPPSFYNKVIYILLFNSF